MTSNALTFPMTEAWNWGSDAVPEKVSPRFEVQFEGSSDKVVPSICNSTSVPQRQELISHFDHARQGFERHYSLDPERAVSRLLENVSRWEGAAVFGLSPIQAAAILLSHLPKAAYGRQNLLMDALKRFALPSVVIQGAISVSHTPSGPEILKAAAGLLEHYASDAWPALEQLASSECQECRYFIRQIAGRDGISEQLRVQALARLAQHADEDLRNEIVEILESGVFQDPSPVWRALAMSERGIDRQEVIAE